MTFSYTEFGTVTMMYNYLKGDLRKKVLKYVFIKEKYSKRDTELVDTWLDAVRNMRNYCAHNSMVVGMTSSVVLRDSVDDEAVLLQDNDLFSRLYAMKKLLPEKDAENLKKDLKKLIRASKVDIYMVSILPEKWEEMYDKIHSF